MKPTPWMASLLGAALACSGTAFAGERETHTRGEAEWERGDEGPADARYGGERDRQREWEDGDRQLYIRDDRDSYFHRLGYAQLDIPSGQFPPPGQCRIWNPQMPPGQQPPPGDCGTLLGQVPEGSWLIQHPAGEDPDLVFVAIFEEQQPGDPVIVGEFDIGSGHLVRVVEDPDELALFE